MRNALKIAAVAVATILIVGWLGFRIGGAEKRIAALESPKARGFLGPTGSFLPQGGGGGGSVSTTSPPMDGDGTAGDPLNLSSSGCVAGDAWISDGAGGWSCDPAGAAGAGDLTEVQVGDGLAVATGTGPVPVISISEAGCTAGDTQTFVSAGVWSCDLPPQGDLTAITQSGGLTLTSGTGPVPDLAVDTTAIQARVTGTCAAGSSIRIIDSAGAVTCETDDTGTGDLTEVQVGRGLAVTSGTGPIPSLRTAHPNDAWRCYDEMTSVAATVGGCAVSAAANNGTVANAGNNIDDTHQGTITLTTVTNTASRAGYLSPSGTPVVVVGTNVNLSFETWVNISALSDGTDTYILRVGFIDSISGEPVDAVMFRYNAAVDTDWQCVVRANNVETLVDSTIAVAATTWTKLRVEIDGTSAVRFFIADVERCAATSVANLPTGATRATGLGALMVRSAGTASRTVDLDYYDVIGTFITPR
jgi:hypothetical protein